MRLRIPISLAIVSFGVVASVGTAHAKVAPTEVTIDGDALAAPIHLDIDDASPPSDPFYRIVEGSGFYEATVGDMPIAGAAAPTDALGPSLVLTYAVDEHGQGSGTLRQVVYPHAQGGPLTYTEPGQRFFDSLVSSGGWYRASGTFVNALEDVGVPIDGMRAPAGATPDPIQGPETVVGEPSPWLNGVIAAAVVLGVVGAIMAVRRTRLAPG
jgi:hypothetical protein